MPWAKFLKAHWDAIAAADFFTVEVWTVVGLSYLRCLASPRPQTQTPLFPDGN